MPGLEIEFTRNGIELDNLSLSALLKLCFLTGMTGMATGVYVGLQAGAAWFTEDKVKKVCPKRDSRALFHSKKQRPAITLTGVTFFFLLLSVH